MASAPVCHIPGPEVIKQPAPGRLPAIPLATDMESLLAASNAMRQILMQITKRPTNEEDSNVNGTRTTNAKKTTPPKPGRWNESKRTTEKVDIPIIDDTGETIGTVTIDRINLLTMTDKVTGETWNWTRGASPA